MGQGPWGRLGARGPSRPCGLWGSPEWRPQRCGSLPCPGAGTRPASPQWALPPRARGSLGLAGLHVGCGCQGARATGACVQGGGPQARSRPARGVKVTAPRLGLSSWRAAGACKHCLRRRKSTDWTPWAQSVEEVQPPTTPNPSYLLLSSPILLAPRASAMPSLPPAPFADPFLHVPLLFNDFIKGLYREGSRPPGPPAPSGT